MEDQSKLSVSPQVFCELMITIETNDGHILFQALEQGAKEDEAEQNGVKYQAGDFVYITPK